jgi:hypothetical protein
MQESGAMLAVPFAGWTDLPGGQRAHALDTTAAGEQLYNGIRLPAEWPPRYTSGPTREPMMVPYLHYVPEVIPIDLGRQLFVDDFLIEASLLRRRYHSTTYSGQSHRDG